VWKLSSILFDLSPNSQNKPWKYKIGILEFVPTIYYQYLFIFVIKVKDSSLDIFEVVLERGISEYLEVYGEVNFILW